MARDNSPSLCSNEMLTVKMTETKGWGVFSKHALQPSTLVCDYGGALIRTKEIMMRKLKEGNDKMWQMKGRELWWDGTKSKTAGKYVNHQCDCIANCEVIWTKRKNKLLYPQYITKADKIIDGDVALSVDYGYDFDETIDGPDMNWLRNYKCPICGLRTSLNN